ncbi:MAG: winged helix DNA-binding domain-containing protein, partial [Solirubrobacterales bacterium]|nr:winged helix DNA-binding domain-containing protein [Solirubrobacterales bacterium]
GTAHLIAAEDLPWIHSLTGPRNRRYFDNLMAKRGNLELARSMLPDMATVLEEQGPLSRAAVLKSLEELGHPSLGPRSVNVVMAWAAAAGVVLGVPDGRFRAAEPPPAVDEDEALAILGRRYLEGYGPAGVADLAKWSGFGTTVAARALDAVEKVRVSDDLWALPGAAESEPPPPPNAKLLGAFDTTMLGWRSREVLVPAGAEQQVMPGGGIVRSVLLARGRAAATWRFSGSGKRRTLELERFGRGPAAATLRTEAADVARFLGFELAAAA